jgi:hypothetical protein
MVIFGIDIHLKQPNMKKVFLLATAAFLVTGIAFAHDGDKKKKDEKCEKACCKASGKECKKDDKKETKETAKATAKPATKKA